LNLEIALLLRSSKRSYVRRIQRLSNPSDKVLVLFENAAAYAATMSLPLSRSFQFTLNCGLLGKKKRNEMPKAPIDNPKPISAISAAGMSLAALGVVFGDIGTSPLYTLKAVLNLTGANPDATTTLGPLSLILRTLFVVATVKYVNVAMRIDNDGEGGIIALPGREDCRQALAH
jgi:hypothetical protein